MASADVERAPDVMQGRQRSQKEHRTRRYSRKTSEDSEPSPRTGGGVAAPAVEQRRRGRPDGIRNLFQRRQQAALRRSSESALLPPIRAATLRQPGSSPTHDANDTSSPISNLSFPVGSENGNGPPTGSSSVLVPVLEHEARSPHQHQRRETNSMLSAADSDTPRLSPIASSDHLRQKAERRMLKSVNDAINECGSPKSPTAAVESSVLPAPPSKAPAVRSKVNRRVSMQSLPKLSANEEPFSIRRKIEQFRKWHEEQYAEKLKKLKVDGEKDRRHADDTSPPSHQAPEIDFAKLLEDNMKKSWDTGGEKSREKDNNGNPLASEKDSSADTRRKAARCKSGATWRTWRDANDSYAYSDVSKYIEDNELLPPERVKWISEWIGDVDKALTVRRGGQEAADSLTVDLPGFP